MPAWRLRAAAYALALLAAPPASAAFTPTPAPFQEAPRELVAGLSRAARWVGFAMQFPSVALPLVMLDADIDLHRRAVGALLDQMTEEERAQFASDVAGFKPTEKSIETLASKLNEARRKAEQPVADWLERRVDSIDAARRTGEVSLHELHSELGQVNPYVIFGDRAAAARNRLAAMANQPLAESAAAESRDLQGAPTSPAARGVSIPAQVVSQERTAAGKTAALGADAAASPETEAIDLRGSAVVDLTWQRLPEPDKALVETIRRRGAVDARLVAQIVRSVSPLKEALQVQSQPDGEAALFLAGLPQPVMVAHGRTGGPVAFSFSAALSVNETLALIPAAFAQYGIAVQATGQASFVARRDALSPGEASRLSAN